MTTGQMIVLILTVLNIPTYLFLGWLAFDNKDNAAVTFGDTLLAILKQIFVPRIVRVLMEDDDDSGWGIVAILGFFFACGAVVYGEYWLVDRFFGPF